MATPHPRTPCIEPSTDFPTGSDCTEEESAESPAGFPGPADRVEGERLEPSTDFPR